MDITDRQPRPRSSPMWVLMVVVAVIALIVGAVGESLVEPEVARTVSTARVTVENAVGALAAMATAEAPSARAQGAARGATTGTGQSGSSTARTTGPQAVEVPAPGTEPIVAVVDKAGPTVVTVINQLGPQVGPFGQIANPEALGSGVIIDKDGHIVTNNHVVAGGSKFEVIFSDGRKASAQLIGRDAVSDVAVLKVDGKVPAVASFGDSSKLQVGQQVVAIGSALGNFQNTVTHGIVSGLDRSLPADQNTEGLSGLIQTDAPINHGNSGGPLLNMQGQVIGLNTAVVRGSGLSGDVAEGLGFAIPSDTVQQIAQQLMKSGFVARPYLGVNWEPLSPQIGSYYGLNVTAGALIGAVMPGSPAATAGLKPGDVVTAVDGTKIDAQHDFATLLLNHKIGDKVQLTVKRGQQDLTLTATLGQRPQNTQ